MCKVEGIPAKKNNKMMVYAPRHINLRAVTTTKMLYKRTYTKYHLLQVQLHIKYPTWVADWQYSELGDIKVTEHLWDYVGLIFIQFPCQYNRI